MQTPVSCKKVRHEPIYFLFGFIKNQLLPALRPNVGLDVNNAELVTFRQSGVRCTCGDDWADVASAQLGPADSRPGDVGPVNHLLNTVVSHSDHHPVLRENAGRDRRSHSSGDAFKESFV